MNETVGTWPRQAPRRGSAPRGPWWHAGRAAVCAAFLIAGAASAQTVAVDVPAQPLDKALNALARQTGARIVFSTDLADKRSAPALKGSFTVEEALDRLLAGSGLARQAMASGGYTVALPSPAKGSAGDAAAPRGETLELNRVVVKGKRAVGPIPGMSLTLEEIPGNVQSLSAEQIKAAHALSLTDLMNSELQSVNVNDYQGNPFQMDVSYRGFTAGPQLGTPQGLSVFLDGIRVNEPFGDIVNWDLVPMNALSGLDVFPGSNPVYGYNTLGGALALRTKNGFDNPGVNAEVLTGSFGRRQLQVSIGGSQGPVGGFFAANLFDENGWRDNSPSKVNQVFGKASWREGPVELDGSVLDVGTRLVGNGLIPMEMYEKSHTAVFSSPDETKNKLLQLQLAGAFKVNEVFSVTGQIYQRKSRRVSSSGDINDNLGGQATRRRRPGENPVCAYPDTNKDGLIDYYVVTQNISDGFGNFTSGFEQTYNNALGNGSSDAAATAAAFASLDPKTFNAALPAYYADIVRANNYNNQTYNLMGPAVNGALHPLPNPPVPTGLDGSVRAVYHMPNSSTGAAFENYYVGADGLKRFLVNAQPLNQPCGVGSVNERLGYPSTESPVVQVRDGAEQEVINKTQGSDVPATGVIEGTPVSVISDSAIKQFVRGVSTQLNWNGEQHKFLVGASFDHARSSYENCQQLGLFDANRRAYLDPDNIGEEFAAASECVRNNDFGGTSQTRSLYASETYTPVPTVHLNAALRFNQTRVQNALKVRLANAEVELAEYKNSYDYYTICPGGALSDCSPDALYRPRQGIVNALGFNSDETNGAYIAPTTRESYKYHSLNPSFGGTWQVREDLNVYANWNQGARTPSVIELGCAFDRTPILQADGSTVPRGLITSNACNLPSALSGDPYLKQITSRTTEIGMRGQLSESVQWNVTAYRTNILDDIYLVGFGPGKSFFDTIPKTRRQGLEMGVSGRSGRADFKLNYALTDATIQSSALLVSPYNSEAGFNSGKGDYQQITTQPGDRLPGVPLQNLNFSIGYKVTDRWHIGLKGVAHSGAYVRGNENNDHQAGVRHEILQTLPDPNPPYGYIYDQPTGLYTSPSPYPGRTPGYAVFSLKTDYRFDNGLTLLLLVNNLFNRSYASAGRLGLNPFSPSTSGAIGASGFNYNSNEWRSTDLIAPGAPRAAWIALSYEL